jgi:3-hydroxyacyl-CoA dehydrogenase / enoyl-CoA hydratase / 3-hydroxybutyryl-CoA epimerase
VRTGSQTGADEPIRTPHPRPLAEGERVLPSVWFEPSGADGIGRIVIDRPDDSVNAVDARLVDDLGDAVRAARADAGLRGLIVVSGKPTQFVAGADLKMVTAATDPHQIEAASRRFQAVLDELAWLPCTTVAAIDGPALGGGLELALACDYRVALDARRVSVGQPEVNLGLVPAGGGTQRLPRLVGLQRALDLILGGRRLNASRARRVGLVDEVVHPAVLEQAARTWARKPKRPLDRPLKLALSLQAAADVAELVPVGRQFIYRQARNAVLARTHGQYPAPLRALEAIESGIEHGLVAGLEAETRAFGELAATETARNLIWLFLATQKQKRQKRPPLPVGEGARKGGSSARKPPSPQSSPRGRGSSAIGVVGAGFMGAAIAEVAAAAGLSVRVRDANPDAVASGLARIRRLVDDGVARRRFQPREANQILQRVSGTVDYSGFSTAALIIEAVFEDLNVKHAVVRELEAVLPADAVIASNTSALPIHEIARSSIHPERVVGMHFFSPAERMPLLEVIRPRGADDWAVERAVAVGTQMGKTVIVVGDAPGFYTSRVLGVMLNEAAILLSEGARMEDVDRAMTAFGFPVGPFVLYDEVGLEVAQHVGESMSRALGQRVPPASVVAQLVAAGQTGRRAGAGFYLWPRSSRVPRPLRGALKRPNRTPNPAVYRITAPSRQRDFSEEAIQDRLAKLFVNEAIRCLEEGVLQSPTDGDLGAVLGLGFPPFRGGPFHYADSLGLASLAARLHELAAQHGSRFEPPGLLVDRARAGRKFFSGME